jgi:hypothetical protein
VQKNREQRTQKNARVVTDSLETKDSAAHRRICGRGDERIARRGTRPGTESVEESTTEHTLPPGSQTN